MKAACEKSNVRMFMYIPIVLGVVAGSLLFLYLILHGNHLTEDEFLQYPSSDIASFGGLKLVVFILKRRLPQFVFLWILLNICPYQIVLSGCSMIFGGYYGYIMSQLFYQFGKQGILYGIVCFFPHYICYGISLFLAGKWFYHISNESYLARQNVKNAQYFFKFFVIIIIFFLGVFWEIKFQKNILKFFYQHLV